MKSRKSFFSGLFVALVFISVANAKDMLREKTDNTKVATRNASGLSKTWTKFQNNVVQKISSTVMKTGGNSSQCAGKSQVIRGNGTVIQIINSGNIPDSAKPAELSSESNTIIKPYEGTRIF